MNYTEQDLEKTLRSAPQPAAPRALQQQLIEQIRAGGGTHQLSAQTKLSKAWRRNNRWRWLQRWWPALGPAALSLACAAVLTSQQFEIRGLKQQLQAASGHVTENGRAATAVAPTPRDSAASTETAPVDEEAEIQRLKAL